MMSKLDNKKMKKAIINALMLFFGMLFISYLDDGSISNRLVGTSFIMAIGCGLIYYTRH